MSLNLNAPLRTALKDDAMIAAILSEWKGEPSIFTRRPVPDDATEIMLVIGPDLSIGNEDALVSQRPVVSRDIIAYGRKGPPGDAADQTREVEALGYLLRAKFHRKKWSITVPGYQVFEITVQGPFVAPTDDDSIMARGVSLTIKLKDLAT